MNNQDLFCTRCGMNVAPTDRFCGHCGARLAVKPAPASTPAPSRPAALPGRRSLAVRFLAVLLLGSTGVGAWYMFLREERPKPLPYRVILRAQPTAGGGDSPREFGNDEPLLGRPRRLQPAQPPSTDALWQTARGAKSPHARLAALAGLSRTVHMDEERIQEMDGLRAQAMQDVLAGIEREKSVREEFIKHASAGQWLRQAEQEARSVWGLAARP